MIGKLSPVHIVRLDQLREEDMTRGVPVLDPAVHLKGATPEKLARALFRRVEPLPPRVGQTVAGDEVAVEEITTDEASDGVAHLGKRS